MAADHRSHEAAGESPVSPHEAREFRNAVEYTLQITFVVAGGARWRTAYTRARRVAERLANAAARAKHVVEVRAVAGPSHQGQLTTPERVCFEAANSGRATNAEPGKLDRYLDPDYEQGLVSLAQANAAFRARQSDDRRRRRAVGCANRSRLSWETARPCGCVYCRPDVHWADRREQPDRPDREPGDATAGVSRCVCGIEVAGTEACCSLHADHQVVALDGDPESLWRLADLDRHRHPPPPVPDPAADPPDPGIPPPAR